MAQPRPPRLVLFGATPTARALCRLAKAMAWKVDVVDPDAERAGFPAADRVLTEPPCEPPRAGGDETYVVVATTGRGDEEAVVAALALEPAYLGLVPSGRAFADLRALLARCGAPEDALARIHSPAGLDLGAATPDERALAILAEIVQARHRAG